MAQIKGLKRRIFKCSFCDKTIAHLGEHEIELGWGKAIGKADGIDIDLYHCPDHADKFQQTLVDVLLLASK